MEIDFKMLFPNKNVHNNLSNCWIEYTKIFLKRAYEKTNLPKFNIENLRDESKYYFYFHIQYITFTYFRSTGIFHVYVINQIKKKTH